MNTQLYQLFPGQPHGRARNGLNVVVNSDPHTRRFGNGSASSKNFSMNAPAYENGEAVIISQDRFLSSGTEDNYEVNWIESGGGTANIVLKNPLGRNYNNAQIINIREYRNMRLDGFTVTPWDGLTGGSFALADAGRTTGSGSINGNGKNGFPSTTDHNISGGLAEWRNAQKGGGFMGGWNSTDGNTSGSGEGWGSGWGTTAGNLPETQTPADNGGAGKTSGPGGGATDAGNADLTSMHMGAGGGGANAPGQDGPGSGGNGGCKGWIWSADWQNTGGIYLNGGNGGDTTNPPYGGGGTADGGGANGGQLRASLGRGNIGAELWEAQRGLSPNSSNHGTHGKIRIFRGGPVTGDTLPAATVSFDPFLVQLSGGAMLMAAL